MRKYGLPLLVCGALGALIVILVKMGDDPSTGRQKTDAKAPPTVTQPVKSLEPRRTRTPLDRHRWLSELERALQRKDLSHARTFCQRVCEGMTAILEDEELTRNLLDLIREHGINSNDPRKRDILLPMLRAVAHPEATKMVEAEYYRTQNHEEKMVLLEAMAIAHHDPQQALALCVATALNAETAGDRYRAYRFMRDGSGSESLTVDTALQIYESTTRSEQAKDMLGEIAFRSARVPAAVEFLRELMVDPRDEQLGYIFSDIEAWGTDEDAARLEALAAGQPAKRKFLLMMADKTRHAYAQRLYEEAKARGEAVGPEPAESTARPPTRTEQETGKPTAQPKDQKPTSGRSKRKPPRKDG